MFLLGSNKDILVATSFLSFQIHQSGFAGADPIFKVVSFFSVPLPYFFLDSAGGKITKIQVLKHKKTKKKLF